MKFYLEPYTYLIGWSKLNKFYYGVQYGSTANPSNLFHSYFTSSKSVRLLMKDFGEPDIIEIRKTFSNGKDARLWESKVLRRMKVLENNNWLNDNVGGMFEFTPEIKEKMSKVARGSRKHRTAEHNAKISEALKGKQFRLGHTHSENTKQKMSQSRKRMWANFTPERRHEIAMKSANTRKLRGN